MLYVVLLSLSSSVFFFNDTATTEIYTLSLHDALPIFCRGSGRPLGRFSRRRWRLWRSHRWPSGCSRFGGWRRRRGDRKSTRLDSSHANISYAVFCFKKKNTSTKSYIVKLNHHIMRLFI